MTQLNLDMLLMFLFSIRDSEVHYTRFERRIGVTDYLKSGRDAFVTRKCRVVNHVSKLETAF